MKKKNRSYTKEFKQEIVEYFRKHSEMTGKQIAELFGVKPDVINRWKREDKDFESKSLSENENYADKQMIKDKRTIARLKEENEILKKAMAIFSRREI